MRELPFPPDFDQSGVQQFLDVVREGGGGDWQLATDIAARELRAFRDSRQDFVTARIRKRLADPMKLLGIHNQALGYATAGTSKAGAPLNYRCSKLTAFLRARRRK